MYQFYQKDSHLKLIIFANIYHTTKTTKIARQKDSLTYHRRVNGSEDKSF